MDTEVRGIHTHIPPRIWSKLMQVFLHCISFPPTVRDDGICPCTLFYSTHSQKRIRGDERQCKKVSPKYVSVLGTPPSHAHLLSARCVCTPANKPSHKSWKPQKQFFPLSQKVWIYGPTFFSKAGQRCGNIIVFGNMAYVGKGGEGTGGEYPPGRPKKCSPVSQNFYFLLSPLRPQAAEIFC